MIKRVFFILLICLIVFLGTASLVWAQTEVGDQGGDEVDDGGGVEVEDKETLFGEVAGYLHTRGIVSLSILKGVDKNELVEFFKVIKQDAKIIRKEGILKYLPPLVHIKLKKLDYSSLLGSAKEEVTVEDKQMWQSLTSILSNPQRSPQ